jgi:gluconolactonase
MWKFEEIKRANGNLTEGPVWDGKGLIFTDGRSDRLLRYDPSTNQTDVFFNNTEGPNGLNFNSKGELFGCEQKGRKIVKYEGTGKKIVVDKLNGKRLSAPNDLAIDNNENIWFSDQIGNVDSKPSLSFSCVIKAEENSRGEYSAKRMTYDCTSPNGLIFSKDYRRLYVAQSDFNGNQRRQLRSYELDKNSNLIPHQVLHDFGPHRGIDGMALDIEGNIIATCGWEISGPGPMICVFDENGRILMSERTPCMRPSNLAFGGENLEDIYITSLEGHLYRVKNTGLKGNPLP